jgi:hypothetical protein
MLDFLNLPPTILNVIGYLKSFVWILIEAKCWIQIRFELNADPEDCIVQTTVSHIDYFRTFWVRELSRMEPVRGVARLWF